MTASRLAISVSSVRSTRAISGSFVEGKLGVNFVDLSGGRGGGQGGNVRCYTCADLLHIKIELHLATNLDTDHDAHVLLPTVHRGELHCPYLQWWPKAPGAGSS